MYNKYDFVYYIQLIFVSFCNKLKLVAKMFHRESSGPRLSFGVRER